MVATIEEKAAGLRCRWEELFPRTDDDEGLFGPPITRISDKHTLKFPAPRVVTNYKQATEYTEVMIEMVMRGSLTEEEYAYLRLLGALADQYVASQHGVLPEDFYTDF